MKKPAQGGLAAGQSFSYRSCVPPLGGMGRRNPSRSGLVRRHEHSPSMAGEVAAHVQGFGLKAAALFFVRVSNSPVANRETEMMKFAYKVGSGIALAAIVLAFSPLFILALAKDIWERIELRAVYGGDAQARDKDRWSI